MTTTRLRPVPLRQQGLSLIELMVAMSIGLLLTVALTNLMISTSRSFRVQDYQARMQENGAMALRLVTEDLRMAGFYAMNVDAPNFNETYTTANISIPAADDCGTAPVRGDEPVHPWAIDLLTPVQFDSALTPASVNAVFPCIDPLNFRAGSPVLAVRGALGTLVNDDPSGATPKVIGTDELVLEANYQNRLWMQAVPTGQPPYLYKGANYDPLKAPKMPDNREAPIFEFRTHVYYIQNCSRFNSGSTCDPGGADDGGQPIPTLVRYQLQPDPITGALTMNLVPVVEGVEALNILFGVDGIDPANPNPNLLDPATYRFAPDGVVDRFVVPPGNAPDLFWQHVAAVRVSALIRSPDMIPNHVDAVDLDPTNPDNKSYDLGLDVNGAPIVMVFPCNTIAGNPNACRYQRHVYTVTAKLRNCAGRGAQADGIDPIPGQPLATGC